MSSADINMSLDFSSATIMVFAIPAILGKALLRKDFLHILKGSGKDVSNICFLAEFLEVFLIFGLSSGFAIGFPDCLFSLAS